MFVVDASNSISAHDLEETKTMIRDFTNELVTEDGGNRLGVIVVRTYAEVHLSLGEGVTNQNKDEIIDTIEQIEYIPNHLTNTADGLCKLSEQPWRENASNVIQVAIVFSDGRSNHESYHSDKCGRDLNGVSNYIHTNHSHILVFGVGIGSDIDTAELSLISSGNHTVKLRGYGRDDLNMLDSTLRYQICYTCKCKKEGRLVYIHAHIHLDSSLCVHA